MKDGLSNKVQIKIIRMARTISDMRGEQSISDSAIDEALTMRRVGKGGERDASGTEKEEHKRGLSCDVKGSKPARDFP